MISPSGIPLLQADALRVWAEDSAKIKRFRGSDRTEDFIRLMKRIIPLEGNVLLYRAEGFKRRADWKRRIAGILSAGGISAGRIGLSFSRDPEVALALAGHAGNFRIMFRVDVHTTARDIAPCVAAVSAGHEAECEVVFTHGRRFLLIGEPRMDADPTGDIWHFTLCEENP